MAARHEVILFSRDRRGEETSNNECGEHDQQERDGDSLGLPSLTTPRCVYRKRRKEEYDKCGRSMLRFDGAWVGGDPAKTQAHVGGRKKRRPGSASHIGCQRKLRLAFSLHVRSRVGYAFDSPGCLMLYYGKTAHIFTPLMHWSHS